MLKQLLSKALGRSDIMFGDSLYMKRWRLIHNKMFGLRVHKIVRDDSDRELHDHPFNFVSVILKGGYWEYTLPTEATRHLAQNFGGQMLVKSWYGPGSVIKRSAEMLHRLELYQGEPAWTLVFRGGTKRNWGFVGADGAWIPNEQFVTNSGAKEVRSLKDS